MSGRSLFQLVEPGSAIDGSVAQDWKVIGNAMNHMMALAFPGFSFGLGDALQYLAVVAAIYLFILDRTNWRTNVLTALLVPYIVLNVPEFLLAIFRGEIGHWFAFIAVVIKLFFPRNIPDHTELPGALIVLLVTTPALIINWRFDPPGQAISILIGAYLAFEHVSSAGGFRKLISAHGAAVAIGILLLFVAPIWQFFL